MQLSSSFGRGLGIPIRRFAKSCDACLSADVAEVLDRLELEKVGLLQRHA